MRRVFGITLVDYNRMADSQGFTCAICRDVVEDKAAKMPGKARALHVDHCHRTGKIRQLLCGRCNSILGLCDESVERLQLIAQYILDHQ